LDKQAFMNKKKLFTGNLSIVLEKRIVKSVLWSVKLYASETRTMTQADEQPWWPLCATISRALRPEYCFVGNTHNTAIYTVFQKSHTLLILAIALLMALTIVGRHKVTLELDRIRSGQFWSVQCSSVSAMSTNLDIFSIDCQM